MRLSTMVSGTTSPWSSTARPRRPRFTWMVNSLGPLSSQYITVSFDQIGTGFTEPEMATEPWPATPGGWYGFVGQINDVRVWSEARTVGAISQDMITAPSGSRAGAGGRLSLQRRPGPYRA